MLNLKLSWFDERARAMLHPAPWQSAHLELANIPDRYAWQDLRLYTHPLSAQATPVYLKKKQKQHFHLHADWMAAEPGMHHIRLVHTAQPQVHLWETHFFLAAPPLTEELWLKILQETYHDSRLRFQPQPQVPFHAQATSKHTPPPIISEFHTLFSLLTGEPGLQNSLKHLPFNPALQWTPLYRLQKVPPALLFRHVSAQPLHTRVLEPRILPEAPLANYLSFLVQTLFSRLKHLCYLLPQSLNIHPFLMEHLQSMWRQGTLLWQDWQQHAYAKASPQWGPHALAELKALATQIPALKVWVYCAQCLTMSVRPDLAPHYIAMGYQGFGYVYQSWCTASLKNSLHTALLPKGWQNVAVQHDPKSLCWEHPETGQRLLLRAEHRFSPEGPGQRGPFSVSRGQQPDVCLLWFKDIDHWQRFAPHKGLVFEIKFRQEGLRPRKIDLDRLHAYRDAIYTQRNGRSVPLFRGGALLYPGQHENYPPGLQALTCLPDQELKLEYLLTLLLNPITA